MHEQEKITSNPKAYYKIYSLVDYYLIHTGRSFIKSKTLEVEKKMQDFLKELAREENYMRFSCYIFIVIALDYSFTPSFN